MAITKQTRAEHIANIPARWAKQYPDLTDTEGKWAKAPITIALQALPEGFTKEQVDEIIGNTSWTSFRCDECKEEVDALINLCNGDPSDYDTSSYDVCKKCLREAMRQMNAK